MPSGVGIALNPGAEASVPIYPEGVGYLAATLIVSDGTLVRVGRAGPVRFPVDVTFPGENEPDQVDAWISAYAEPFYIRS